MLQIKIADFGLCRECNEDNMYEPTMKKRDLPLRWMSFEALRSEKVRSCFHPLEYYSISVHL